MQTMKKKVKENDKIESKQIKQIPQPNNVLEIEMKEQHEQFGTWSKIVEEKDNVTNVCALLIKFLHNNLTKNKKYLQKTSNETQKNAIHFQMEIDMLLNPGNLASRCNFSQEVGYEEKLKYITTFASTLNCSGQDDDGEYLHKCCILFGLIGSMVKLPSKGQEKFIDCS